LHHLRQSLKVPITYVSLIVKVKSYSWRFVFWRHFLGTG